MKEYIGGFLKKYFPTFYKYILDRKSGRLSYTFDSELYPGSFLNHETNIPDSESSITPVIYCFWTGDNEMSENRKRGLKSIEDITGFEVILITPQNLPNYIKPEHPLHPGYSLLSLVHRSDYLRCYFMHHYGGGYADIKTFKHSWKKAFKKLRRNKNKFLIGYPEIGGIAEVGGKLYKDMVFHMPLLVGNCAYICKSYTSFTAEWYQELHRRMDEYYPLLKSHSIGELPEYPVPYTYLLGNIFHPLSLKYHAKILQEKDLMPSFINYK